MGEIHERMAGLLEEKETVTIPANVMQQGAALQAKFTASVKAANAHATELAQAYKALRARMLKEMKAHYDAVEKTGNAFRKWAEETAEEHADTDDVGDTPWWETYDAVENIVGAYDLRDLDYDLPDVDDVAQALRSEGDSDDKEAHEKLVATWEAEVR